MKYVNFDIYDDNGILIETVPAILVPGSVNMPIFTNPNTGAVVNNTTVTITAQVPSTTTSVEFVNIDIGQAIATVTPENGIAEMEITVLQPGTMRIRVGNETITKLNEAVIAAHEG